MNGKLESIMQNFDSRAYRDFGDAMPASRWIAKPDFKQSARFYVESIIDACGRVYLVIVTNHRTYNFWTCEYDPVTGACPNTRRHETRTDAIRDVSQRAERWLSK